MNGSHSALVIFSTPSREAFFDASQRATTLERGVTSILANVDGLRLVTKNSLACTASLTGAKDAIARLRDFVSKSALGSVELNAFERPGVLAAKGKLHDLEV